MIKKNPPALKSQFENDVYTGLTSFPKKLSSKYFYDKKGDRLFQQIMELPEYYLTRKEYEILEENKEELGDIFNTDQGFDLIELGAGDGKKTKLLLHHFVEQNFSFKYLPVDISRNALDQLSDNLTEEIPALDIEPKEGTYTEVLEYVKNYAQRRKVILFLGSNIGNFLHEEAADFLKKIAAAMNSDDLLFIGIDQKKDPQKILAAYNDSQGVTAAFNRNILSRINKEMDADFNPENFSHWPVYNPETGITASYLVCIKPHIVHIKTLNLEVDFRKWETIHTEISVKYDDAAVDELAKKAGLEISASFSDSDNYFKNYLFNKT